MLEAAARAIGLLDEAYRSLALRASGGDVLRLRGQALLSPDVRQAILAAWREADRLPCETPPHDLSDWDPCDGCSVGLASPRCPHHSAPTRRLPAPRPCEVDDFRPICSWMGRPMESILAAELLDYAPSLGRGEGDYEGGGRR